MLCLCHKVSDFSVMSDILENERRKSGAVSLGR